MHVMRLLPLVLLYVGSRSEVCESRPGQGAALLQQKSIKELFYTSVPLQEEHDDKKILSKMLCLKTCFSKTPRALATQE